MTRLEESRSNRVTTGSQGLLLKGGNIIGAVETIQLLTQLEEGRQTWSDISTNGQSEHSMVWGKPGGSEPPRP